MIGTAYLGIDLAWSDGNTSGCCALDGGGRAVDERLLGADADILAWIDDHTAGRTVVAIDAPLRVPNETGRLPAEAELHRDFASRKAGPHSTNRRNLLRMTGRIRGEDLAAELARRGFGGPWDGGNLTMIDVYPHPAIVEAFGLPERLLYKQKKGVTVGRRREGLRALDGLLGRLASADPPLLAAPVAVTGETRGAQLKAVEDRLDARVCAWIASVWGTHGTDRVRLYGSREEGHIAVPIGAFA